MLAAVGINKWWFWWGFPVLAFIAFLLVERGEEQGRVTERTARWIILGLVAVYVANMLGTLVDWDNPGQPDPNRECIPSNMHPEC